MAADDDDGFDGFGSARWRDKTNYAPGVPDDPDAIPEVRFQVLLGRVHVLKRWRDGSTVRGELDLDFIEGLSGAPPREGWYDALGTYLGADPGLEDQTE